YLVINHAWRLAGPKLWSDKSSYDRFMTPVGLVLTFVSVAVAMVFFRSPTVTSAIDLIKGMTGVNGIGLPKTLLEGQGTLAGTLRLIGVMPEALSVRDFAKIGFSVVSLMFIALACPNTLQILARYEPALGVKSKSPKPAIIEWNASLPWAIAVSVIAAIAIAS